MMEATGFVFLPSYYDAIMKLPKEYRGPILEAVCTYGITGQMPDTEDGVILAFMALIEPNLNAGKQRYANAKENGKKGGNPNFKKGQPNPYYRKDNPKDNPPDNLNKEKETEMEKDSDTDREKERESDSDSGCLSQCQPTDDTAGLGPYKNVFLSSWERKELQRLLPTKWQDYILTLSAAIDQHVPLPPGENHYRMILNQFEKDFWDSCHVS